MVKPVYEGLAHKYSGTDLKDLEIWLESQLYLIHEIYKNYLKVAH